MYGEVNKMINITTNHKNANRNRLEKNEPLRLCVTMEANDLIKVIIGGVLLITLIGIVMDENNSHP